MTLGSPIDTEYGRSELLIADSAGRILQLDSRGVFGDGKYAAGGAFNGGYPSEESANYKKGAVSANLTGTVTSVSTDKLINSAASFPDWVNACLVWNMTTSKLALVAAKDSGTQLSLADQGYGSDIFTQVGESYSIVTAGGIGLGSDVYSYIVDTSAAWTPAYGKGTAFNYLGLRGLWCVVERATTGQVERRKILANESNKLWFSGSWTMWPTAADTYYVAGIYFEFDTGYIYPQQGDSVSLTAMRSRVVSSNASPFWLELFGSGRDQTKEGAHQRKRLLTKQLRNHPHVRFSSQRDKFEQLRIMGVVQDDQIVWRSLEFLFKEFSR